MINIAISSHNPLKRGNSCLASYNRKRKLCQEDFLIFVGDEKHLYNGCFNEDFKYQEVIKKPAKAVYEI